MGSGVFFPLCAIPFSLLIIILFYAKGYIKNKETKIYNVLIISNFFGLIIEILCTYASMIYSTYPFISTIIYKLYLFYIILWISTFTYYIFCVTKNDLKINKGRNILFTIYYLIISVLLIILPIDVVIKDNFNTRYTTGLSINFAYILSAVAISIIIFFLLTNIRKLKNKKYIPVFIFLIIGSIAFYIQMQYPQILMMTYIETLICVIMYFTIENPDVKMINELEYAKNTAEKANRAKSDFLSSMSHEIRTPLNAIVGLSEVIKNSDDIDEIHEDANDVVMASKNLLEIVNGILDISKIEADKMEIIESNYNPVETFGEITSLIESKLDEKNLKLNCNFAEDLPSSLYGDKGKLKQIISNILSNAIKYTEKGHIDFNVNCINEKSKCKLQIIISDTGRGIKPEQIDKIFNKFERAEEDMNSTIEGTGLGLAITKSLVEMMGGKILVHSTYGEGSKFTVLLEQKYSKDEETTKVVKNDKVSYSNKKVLIVDDNKLNIKVASKILKEFELNIDSADSGFSAIEKIENNEHYDIIFMDIMMPKMSGVETLKKLKQIDNFNIPVVALTADAMEGKSTKYIEVGFNDYLSKPINKDELKRVLDKCLNGTIEIEEEKAPEEDPHIHRVIPITDEDIEMLNKKLAEDLTKQKEQEEKEKSNN